MNDHKRQLAEEKAAIVYPGDRYVPMFVYGTLRPGEGNYWIEPAVVAITEDATTPGVMFYVHGSWGGFPVANFDLDGIITGTLLMMDTTIEEYDHACQMEIGAGYQPRMVPVILPGDSEIIMALVWHYSRASDATHHRVENNNWHSRQDQMPMPVVKSSRKNWWDE